MSTTVYKVVVNNNGVLQSINALGKFRTQYPVGSVVRRNNLFVFTSLAHAEDAQFESLGEEVWECETESTPIETPSLIPDYEYTRDNNYKGLYPEVAHSLIKDFWRSPYRATVLALIRPPTGSHLVNDVKLIRRVL